MNEFDRQPGAIDDPGMKGGIDPEVDKVPPGASTDPEGGAPWEAELDMPGPDDPVAWSFVESDTLVVGPDGEELGRVAAMLGTESEGIFHGVAVLPYHDGKARLVPADAVILLTSAKVQISYDREQLAAADEYHAIQ